MSSSERKRKARVNAAAYTPSDFLEAWDPHADSDFEDDGTAPEEIAGLLWKKSPSPLKFGKYQQRYFHVKAGKISWWRKQADVGQKDKMKGCIDLRYNLSRVWSTGSDSKFEFEPKYGTWLGECKFTGSNQSRVFDLDAAGSEHTRADWIRVIQAHQMYAGSDIQT